MVGYSAGHLLLVWDIIFLTGGKNVVLSAFFLFFRQGWECVHEGIVV